ncbi:MAG: hypothetical protein IT206_09195 [Fimbriimonadaceae bacterium]|nr:hypothetical protein [Fimbriimonadaceae bacterium]
MPAKKILLLTRTLLASPESEWQALLTEREIAINELSNVEMNPETREILAEVIALEKEWQSRISAESNELRQALVASFFEQRQIAHYHRQPDPCVSSIEC